MSARTSDQLRAEFLKNASSDAADSKLGYSLYMFGCCCQGANVVSHFNAPNRDVLPMERTRVYKDKRCRQSVHPVSRVTHIGVTALRDFCLPRLLALWTDNI
jgi:hypothetical protein